MCAPFIDYVTGIAAEAALRQELQRLRPGTRKHRQVARQLTETEKFLEKWRAEIFGEKKGAE